MLRLDIHQILTMAPNSTDVRIAITILSAVAQLVTSFRLIYRYRIRRLWWDDAWVTFAMICQLILLIALWIRTDVPGVGPLNESRQARVIAYWIVSFAFTCVLWSARMSMLFSIIRIIPAMMTLRYIAYGVAVLFGLMWAALVVQKAYHCAHNKAWEQLPAPQCHLGPDVAILELCTDFISDVILIILPLRLLWRVSMPSSQRNLLFMLFSASILITIVSIAHAVYVLGPSGLLEALTANIEAAVSLIVANLTVIIMVIYRKFVKREDSERTPCYGDGGSASNSGRFHNSHPPFRPHVSTVRFVKSDPFDIESATIPDAPLKSEVDGFAFDDPTANAKSPGVRPEMRDGEEERHLDRSSSGIIVARETFVDPETPTLGYASGTHLSTH